jgi:hypothetical protein
MTKFGAMPGHGKRPTTQAHVFATTASGTKLLFPFKPKATEGSVHVTVDI